VEVITKFVNVQLTENTQRELRNMDITSLVEAMKKREIHVTY
jgi:hypothetical protein